VYVCVRERESIFVLPVVFLFAVYNDLQKRK
jgi:hypothetical protein